jgi:HlyD family secretion protein
MSHSLWRLSLSCAGLAALLVASACSMQLPGGKPAESDAAAAQEVETPYAAIAAGKVDIEGGLVDVAARAPGIIHEVLVQEGDRVKQDQILARQDDEDARLGRDRVAAQLRQARAQIAILEIQVEAASREAARLSRLLAQNAVSSQAVDQALDAQRQASAQLEAQRAAVSLVQAQLAEADYQVELHVVRAPADGRIVRRYANPGSGASTLQVTPLFQLQPDTQRIVRAEVEERSLAEVFAGQAVEIVPESDQDAAFPGVVVRMAEVMGSRKLRSDDPSERTDERVVEVVVDAESAPVLVGQRVFVKFLKKPTA